MGAVGCAQDVEDIDRTQPDKIKKAHFEDGATWYYRQTVVDTNVTGHTGYGVDDFRPYRKQKPIWTGAVSRKLKRIQWEVHKDVLYARSTVEPARGVTEQLDGEESNRELGIVAAFPIESHFDVQRQYNAQTGEPQNVIVEDKSDRPWHQREYMRVDWSDNLVSATSAVFSGQAWGLMSPKSNVKSSRPIPQEEDRIDPGRTEISKDIVDTTSEYVFNPEIVGCVAALGADAGWRCDGGTATVRNFFWRVEDRKENRYGASTKVGDFDPDQEYYKPMQYRDSLRITHEDSSEPIQASSTFLKGDIVSAACNEQVNERNRDIFARDPDDGCNDATFGLFDRFGYFRTNVANWNEERHTYDSGRIQYANRWNIWERMYDDDGEEIPMEERDPNPVVYHMNAGYPQEMMSTAEAVEREWDRVFKKTVAIAKYDTSEMSEQEMLSKVTEELNGDEGDEYDKMFVIAKNRCHPSKLVQWRGNHGSEVDADRRDPMGVFAKYVDDTSVGNLEGELRDLPVNVRKRLCEELEWATEPRSGEGQYEWQQRGDIRYSFFAWVRELNTGWLGYGPSSADPKTGEIISATANFAGRTLPALASKGADIIKYLNGEYSRETIERGLHVREQLGTTNAEYGESDDSESDEQQQQLEPALGKAADRRVMDEEVPADRQPRIDISKYESKLPDDRKSTGKPPEEFGRTPEFVNEAAYSEIKASEETDAYDSKIIKWLERPEVKQQLMSNPMMSKAVKGIAAERGGPEAAKDEDQLHQAYLSLNAPMLWEQRTRRRNSMLARNNIFSTQAGSKMVQQLALLTGAAKRYEGKKHETIADFIAKEAFYGTQLHEVGHTLGLRHNFSASLDALNYHDEFWQFEKLQQAGCGDYQDGPCSDGELTEREARRGGSSLAEKLVGERLVRTGCGNYREGPCEDGTLNEEEARSNAKSLAQELLGENVDTSYASKAEQRLSSIMDYTAPPRLAGRRAGLGKYDQAAITFAYGRHVQQFGDFEGTPKDLSLDLARADYFRLPAVLGDKQPSAAPRNACLDSDGNLEVGCLERGIKRVTEGRKWVSIDEAMNHKREVLLQNARAAKETFSDEVDGDTDTTVNRLVPYRFCTDDRNGRYLGCQTFDWGSNQFEVTGYSIQEFKTMQPFNRYRGSDVGGRSRLVRLGGLVSSHARELRQTLSLIDTPFRYFSFYKAIDFDLGAVTDDLENAARLGLNFYSDVLTKPKPGRYCYYTDKDNVDPRFNINEKVATPNGLFVPDDVYFRDRQLGKCDKEIARVHEFEDGSNYALRFTAQRSDWSGSRSVDVSYRAQSGDTRADIAAELTQEMKSKVSDRNSDSDSSNDLPSFRIDRVKADIVVRTFANYDNYGFARSSQNGTDETALTSMSSPHQIEKGTVGDGGEYFGYKTSPEYHFRVDRVGSFIDKIVAGSRMFQLDANFTFAQFATDLRAVNISYWTEFPDELYQMIHGLFLGNFRRFGGGFSPSKESYETWNLLPLDRDQDDDGDEDILRGEGLAGGQQEGMPKDTWAFLDPHSFTTRQRLLIFALAEFSTWEDKESDFDEYTVIAATEKERQNLPDSFTKFENGETTLTDEGKKRTIKFVHPNTNRSYIAVAAKEHGSTENRSLSYDLLKWAKRVKAKYQNASDQAGPDEEVSQKEKYRRDLENVVARINLLRRVRAILFDEG